MFSFLARFVSRYWIAILAAWGIALTGLWWSAPPWDDVVEDGQFSFLPDSSPSRIADHFFNQAFPHDLIASSVVVVVARDDQRPLQENDLSFVQETLIPGLQAIADEAAASEPPHDAPGGVPGKGPIVSIHGFDDRNFGSLLRSLDEQATLVIVEMRDDFFSKRNRPVIEKIESFVAELSRTQTPGNVAIDLTGSAMVGRDITLGSERSAEATEYWTVALVIILTLVVFRAPLLSLIPLITLALSMTVALKVLALLAAAGVIEVFRGIEAYTTVVAYASGVDFSLFIISRVEEEMSAGRSFEFSVREAVRRVGAAISASAATEIVGIGMLTFASFGKFHQAGIAISLSLTIMLIALLTVTPALLRLIGPRVFWPYAKRQTTLQEREPSHGAIQRLWERVAAIVLRRPGTVWLVTVAAMLPFALLGIAWYNHLNYDLVATLPATAPSAEGMRQLQQHFPGGTTGPVNVVIRNDQVDFNTSAGFRAVKSLTESLHEARDELRISDVRSLAAPLGTTGAGKLAAIQAEAPQRLFAAGAIHRRAQRYFNSKAPSLENHATRLAVELSINPFSEEAIDSMANLEARIQEKLPESLRAGTEVQLSGATASLRDLKTVGMRDRTLINILVVASVLLILIILLRRVVLSFYLMFTVIFSYLVTLGVTFVVFYLLDPQGFSGLDWTVPLFLFTVLVAIGEDYNILLVTRIQEEQQHLEPIAGVASALIKTGPIISSCGIIMAGTFLSLMIAGELAQMIQLGFALAFGVLLDTFVIRPILVPAYVVCVHRGDFDALKEIFSMKNREPARTSVD